MSDGAKDWDGALVRTWLERRIQAARLEQAAADKQGYEARNDYDKAAAEEWVCGALKTAAYVEAQVTFARRIKHLLDQDEYRTTGIHDDRRFENHVRARLRKLAGMTKANDGFANTSRYQR